MSPADQPTSAPQSAWWDPLLVLVLGAALLVCGRLEVHAYLAHRGEVWPDFLFLKPPAQQVFGIDEPYRRRHSLVLLENIGELETTAPHPFRHALGPRSTILILTDHARARLHFKYENTIDGQDMTVSCDGKVLEQFVHQPFGTITREYTLALQNGINEVTLDFARYNHKGVEFASADGRTIAGTFYEFDLTLE